MPPRIRLVLVDTNVLFPVRLADLVLSSAADGLFDLCVSDDLLDEIERVLIDRKGLAVDKAAAFRKQVEAVARRRIRRAQYRPLAAKLSGPDPDDLLHLAAAVEAGADTLMTWNLADFVGVKISGAQTRSRSRLRTRCSSASSVKGLATTWLRRWSVWVRD